MDPLRPFADAIRSAWLAYSARTRKSQAAAGAASNTHPVENEPRAPRSEEGLRTRLMGRIKQVDAADRPKLREAFVESVLLWQLGDSLAQDPAFADMVAHVSEQLGSDPDVNNRLHRLISNIASHPASR